MQGFDAYGEIQLKSGKTLEPDRIMEITEQIQEFSTQCYTLLGQFCEYGRTVNENVTISIYWENIVGIALFLFALSLFLKPTIKKLAG